MRFEFIKQHTKESISTGDELAIFSERGDGLQSGVFKVADLSRSSPSEIEATLVGIGDCIGHIQVVYIQVDE